MNDFLDNFYGIIFSPNKTFDTLKENPPIVQGFFIVLAVSIISMLITADVPRSILGIVFYVFWLTFSAIVGVTSWLFFAAFLDLVAAVFNKGGKFKEFLALSAFSLLPWLFIAPAFLFKTGWIIDQLIGIVAGLGIWLWATILIVIAISKVYELTVWRVFVMLFIPFLGGFIAFNWVIGFFSTLIQILNV